MSMRVGAADALQGRSAGLSKAAAVDAYVAAALASAMNAEGTSHFARGQNGRGPVISLEKRSQAEVIERVVEAYAKALPAAAKRVPEGLRAL